MTPQEALTAAAAKLRETRAALDAHEDIRGGLDLAEWYEWFGPDSPVYLPEINTWAALMSPALAEPLAALLEHAAWMFQRDQDFACSTTADRCMALARTILGEVTP
jgi:hypothetical protein